MPASKNLQSDLNILHKEFMLSKHTEPLRFLEEKMIPIE